MHFPIGIGCESLAEHGNVQQEWEFWLEMGGKRINGTTKKRVVRIGDSIDCHAVSVLYEILGDEMEKLL